MHVEQPSVEGDAALFTLGETLALISPSRGARISDHGPISLRTGGAESNVAIAAVKQGASATWLGRVGADLLGERVLADIRSQGVHVLPIVDPARTSVMVRESPGGPADRVVYYRDGGPGSRLCPEDLPEDAVRQARVVHLTGVTAALSATARDAAFAVMEIAAEAKVPISFDVNYRSTLWSHLDARPVLADLASRCDILFVGDDERDLIVSDSSEAAAESVLRRLGPTQVLLKRGPRGAVLLTPTGRFEAEPPPVTLVDAVGAGDAFAGAYLAGTLAGRSAQESLTVAVLSGAVTVTRMGDWEASPRAQELTRFVDGRVDVTR